MLPKDVQFAMVGIVFVSHSAKIAEGVRELANQVVQGKVLLATAGGIDDPDNPIGTDAMKVYEAIESVYSDDGVVVLMDLGSALLSTEMALEFLDPVMQANVFLSPAPFVEGALAAAIQASVGGTPDQVIQEAQGALAMKLEHLSDLSEASTKASIAESTLSAEGEELISLIVNNRLGLHARPAAKFVTVANKYVSEIQVTKGDKSANAKSINQVAMLTVRQGDEIQIKASGMDALEVLIELKALADDNFGDSDDDSELPLAEVSTAAPVADGILAGIAASPGIAVGPVALYLPQLPPVNEKHIDDPAAEWTRLEATVSAALAEITALQEKVKQQIGATEAAIFEAHALFLQDPALIEMVRNRVFTDLINVEAAWDQAISEMIAQYRALDNSYMQARTVDIEDAGRRVLRVLMGTKLPSLNFERPSILIAADLSPSDTARLDPAFVLGICTELGGAISHSAILSRALGIPAVVGLGGDIWALDEGHTIAIDGELGRLWMHPDEEQLSELRVLRDDWQEAQEVAKLSGLQPALTLDGRLLEVAANIGEPNDVSIALGYGADGVGLFRTEFLFMNREEMPSENEQFDAYKRAADAMGQKPLIIRTLDVGGDKPLPYIDLGDEDNPFLGWRGIRFCLEQPDLFKPQLRAVLRAGYECNVKIMFPMISSVHEIRAAKAMLTDVQIELRQKGTPFDENMGIGIMIEVPSAVATADLLAAEVDFFSIGTNDLTQYTMAADRGNSNVAELAQALQPAVLRMIKQTVDAAHDSGIWVGMCGELAGNVLAVPLLVGLGLDELSMSAPAIPGVKEAIRSMSCEEAEEIAIAALALDSATAVNAYLTSVHN